MDVSVLFLCWIVFTIQGVRICIDTSGLSIIIARAVYQSLISWYWVVVSATVVIVGWFPLICSKRRQFLWLQNNISIRIIKNCVHAFHLACNYGWLIFCYHIFSDFFWSHIFSVHISRIELDMTPPPPYYMLCVFIVPIDITRNCRIR